MKKKRNLPQTYCKRSWWPVVAALLGSDKVRNYICHDIIDRGFAQLIYNNWEFVIRRFCMAIDRDRRRAHPRWHLGCTADAEFCLQQMLMPYSVEAAYLKQDLIERYRRPHPKTPSQDPSQDPSRPPLTAPPGLPKGEEIEDSFGGHSSSSAKAGHQGVNRFIRL